MIVYKITNKINGHKYIGQTIQTLKTRWREHCSPSSTCCRVLHLAIKKYSKDGFNIEIIDTANSIDELNKKEEYWIKKENTIVPYGYNLLAGGNNKKHHKETCEKMSKTRLGKKVPALSYPRGKYPKEWCEAISRAKKGKSNSLLGTKKQYIPHYKTRKKIIGINIINKEKIFFDSINEAASFLGKSHSNIVTTLKGRRKNAYGYYWFYQVYLEQKKQNNHIK